jgi:hypothetical protein
MTPVAGSTRSSRAAISASGTLAGVSPKRISLRTPGVLSIARRCETTKTNMCDGKSKAIERRAVSILGANTRSRAPRDKRRQAIRCGPVRTPRSSWRRKSAQIRSPFKQGGFQGEPKRGLAALGASGGCSMPLDHEARALALELAQPIADPPRREAFLQAIEERLGAWRDARRL